MTILPDMYPCKPDIFAATYVDADRAMRKQPKQVTQDALDSVRTTVDAFDRWKSDYALKSEPNYSEMTEMDCWAAFKAGISYGRAQAAPVTVPPSLPEPDFTLDGGSVGCFYESTVRRLAAAHHSEDCSADQDPVAWLVYLPSEEAQRVYDSQEDPGYVDDLTNNGDAVVSPLYTHPAEVPAQGDAARLDWMIEHRAYVVSDDTCCDGYWLHWARPDGSVWVQGDEHATPRAAIDAAMAQGKEGGADAHQT